jgi:hypothetical protein
LLELESGPPQANSDGEDYVEITSNYDDFDDDNPVYINRLTAGTNQRAFTHYSIYRTNNIDVDRSDTVFETQTLLNTFIWVADIPMLKALHGRMVERIVTLDQGSFETEDIGEIIVFENGSYAEITGISGALNQIATITNNSGSATTDMCCALGVWDWANDTTSAAGHIFRATQATNTVTIDSGIVSTFTFDTDDVGKYIFWSDRTLSVITEYVSSSSVKVHDSTTRTSLAAAIDPVSRNYNDTVNKEDWEAKQGSGEPLYNLGNRYFEPLPDANLAAIVPGFYVVAIRDYKEYYYSQSGSKRNMGYYHPVKQVGESVVGGLEQLRDYPDGLILRGEQFTYRVNTVVTDEGGDTRFGESVEMLKTAELLDDLIGVKLHGSAYRYDEGAELVFTTEPAVRLFDGYKYGANLASERIQEKEIVKMSPQTLLSYSHISGLHIWGKQEI